MGVLTAWIIYSNTFNARKTNSETVMRHPIQLNSPLLFLGPNSPRVPAKQTLPLYLEAAAVKTSVSDKDVNMTASELFPCLFNLVTGSASPLVCGFSGAARQKRNSAVLVKTLFISMQVQ